MRSSLTTYLPLGLARDVTKFCSRKTVLYLVETCTARKVKRNRQMAIVLVSVPVVRYDGTAKDYPYLLREVVSFLSDRVLSV